MGLGLPLLKVLSSNPNDEGEVCALIQLTKRLHIYFNGSCAWSLLHYIILDASETILEGAIYAQAF